LEDAQGHPDRNSLGGTMIAIKVLQRPNEAYNTRDADGLAATYAEGATYNNPLAQQKDTVDPLERDPSTGGYTVPGRSALATNKS
jgi:hypothetical protein